MLHRLAGPVGPRPIIRIGALCFRAAFCQLCRVRERTFRAALWTSNARNQSSLGDRCNDVPALFVTYFAELLNPVTNRVSLLFNLLLFHERLSQVNSEW